MSALPQELLNIEAHSPVWANQPYGIESICAWTIVALAEVNTPDRRIQLRQGVAEVAVQYAPVEVYEGDAGWYFVANLILPMESDRVGVRPIWRSVRGLSSDPVSPELAQTLVLNGTTF